MDKDELWAKTLGIMLDGVGEDNPKHFFLGQLHPLGVFGDQFILLTNNEQVESWVRRNYLEEISAAALAASGMAYTVQIAGNPATQSSQSPQPAAGQGVVAASAVPVATQTPALEQNPVFAMPVMEPQAAAVDNGSVPEWMNTYVQMSDLPGAGGQAKVQQAQAAQQATPQPAQQPRRAGNEALFSKCTFETFVVGKSNEFARGAALAVAEQPGIVYNPLFIYGSSGLGKTHLLVSIANYISQNYPNMATCYVSANEFLNDYVEATQRNSWSSFNTKYHHADVLLVDDVQYLEGKDETINQLFNIFNEMTSQAKQVVLSADRAPKDIDMDDRMRSRFVSGLLADIKPPDYETRLAIIKNSYLRVQQATTFCGVIPDTVLSWLAESASTNIREMEGAITRLIGNMNLTRKPEITVDEAQEILQDFFPALRDTKVSIATIQAEVERFFQVSHEDIIGSKRSKGITMPRHIAIYLCRYLTDESLESIGKKFGNRDHTTVMHSVNKIEGEQRDNRLMYDQIAELTERIRARS
ncbi:MAG: chromosomal replication initiator protein DnaA [Coriobacteriales bacterium]